MPLSEKAIRLLVGRVPGRSNEFMTTFATPSVVVSIPSALKPTELDAEPGDESTAHIKLAGAVLGELDLKDFTPWHASRAKILKPAEKFTSRPVGLICGAGLPHYLTDEVLLSRYPGEAMTSSQRFVVPAIALSAVTSMGESSVRFLVQDDRLIMDAGTARISVILRTLEPREFGDPSVSITLERKAFKRAITQNDDVSQDWILTKDGLQCGDETLTTEGNDSITNVAAKVDKKLALAALSLSKKPQVTLGIRDGKTPDVTFVSDDDFTVLAQRRF